MKHTKKRHEGTFTVPTRLWWPAVAALFLVGFVVLATTGYNIHGDGTPVTTSASNSYSDAVQATEVGARDYEIIKEHPRLYFTKADIPGIRERLKENPDHVIDDRHRSWVADLDKRWEEPFKPGVYNQHERLEHAAFIYAIGKIAGVDYGHTIDEYGRKAVEMLKTSASHWDKKSAYRGWSTHELIPVCMAYDWVWSLMTEKEKADVAGKMISACYNQLRKSKTYTYSDYAIGGHNGLLVALVLAGDNLQLDHTAQWEGVERKQVYRGNSDELVETMLDILDRTVMGHIYDGWKFAHQGGGAFQGTVGHLGDITYLSYLLDPFERVTGKQVLADFDYLRLSPYWLAYCQIPPYTYTDKDGNERSMKGKRTSTDDENFYHYWDFRFDIPTGIYRVTSRYPDQPILGSLANWYAATFASGMYRDRNTVAAAWHDPFVPAKSPKELGLPLTYFFGKLEGEWPTGTPEGSKHIEHAVGPGIVVMRSDWEAPDATVALFKMRTWGFTHNHPDSGHFSIYKNGYLAIDSGRYVDGDRSPHEANYDYRTIAHNCVTVYDPAEKFDRASNDGGQRLDNIRDDRWSLWTPEFRTDFYKNAAVGAAADKGGMTRFESLPGKYDYMEGDCTRAYQSTLFTNLGNQPKVSLAQRAFVYLRSQAGDRDFFVVFDRINSTKKEFEKRWLLHTVELPTVDGTFAEGGFDGEGGMNEHRGTPGSISHDSNLVTVTQNKGKLFCQTLLPEQHKTVLTGGPNADGVPSEPDSYEYLDAEGTQWPLNKKYQYTTYIRECGNYRVEITPEVAATNDVFLHVIHPVGQDRMPAATLLSSKEGSAYGALVDGRAVIFSSTPRPIDRAMLNLPAAPTQILITNLEPGAGYRVTLKVGELLIAKGRGEQKASKQGTIFIEVKDVDDAAIEKDPAVIHATGLKR